MKEDYTPGGRQIIEAATQGTPLGTKVAAQAVLEAKLSGNMPLNPEIARKSSQNRSLCHLRRLRSPRKRLPCRSRRSMRS